MLLTTLPPKNKFIIDLQSLLSLSYIINKLSNKYLLLFHLKPITQNPLHSNMLMQELLIYPNLAKSVA